MRFLVNAELGRLAMRQNLETSFVAWSILRDYAVAKNHSSHFTKQQAARILAEHGLQFTARHLGRIWQQGSKIFWGLESHRIYLRSFRRVTLRFSKWTKNIDYSSSLRDSFVLIQLTRGLDLRATLYHAWFLQFEEKTISRDTLRDLFGLSHQMQRSYEKHLGDKLLVKSNYAHISLDTYKENPQSLPQDAFTITYEREISLAANREDSPEQGFVTVSAIQYQLPNTFIGRHNGTYTQKGANKPKEAMRKLIRQTDSLINQKRTYWLKWSQFEALGSMDSYIRTYYQGKKRLWLSGHFL